SSRDRNGFPKYKLEYQNNNLIEDLIHKESDRDKLLTLFGKNHSEVMNTLEKYSVLSMSYCLEIDLVASKSACNIFYQVLPGVNQQEPKTQLNLLKNRKNQIKKIENILEVLQKLDNKNLPNSYKRI